MAAVTRGSKWWSGNAKRRGKPFEVVGFKTTQHHVSRKRAKSERGDTHALVRPLDMSGSGSRERFVRLDRFRPTSMGYIPYVEESK